MKRIITVIAIFGACTQLYSQDFGSLLLPRNAEELSMGNVSPVIAPHDRQFGIEGAYMSWSPKILENTVFCGDMYYRIKGKYEINLECRQNKGQPYFISDEVGSNSGQYTPSFLTAGLGFTYKATDHVVAGVKARFCNADIISGNKMNAVAIDLGAQYVSDCFMVEAAGANVGTDYALARVDGYYFNNGLKAGAGVDCLFKGGFMCAAGLEYGLKDIAFFRAGYHYGSAEALPSFASVGFGLKYVGLSLNLAYLLASESLGGSMMVGLGYSF